MSLNKTVNDMTDDEITYHIERLRRTCQVTSDAIFGPTAKVYQEFVPRKGSVEATIYFRHWDGKKYRMDLEFNLTAPQRDVEYTIVKMYNDFLRDGIVDSSIPQPKLP